MEQNQNTHWRTIMNTKFLSGDELPEDGKVVTIKDFSNEKFFSPRTKKEEDNVILLFNELSKPMILTNRKAKQISKALGTPFMGEWANKQVHIYPVIEKHFGEMFKVVNIKKNIVVVKEELTPDSDKWDKAKESLKSGAITIEKIKQHYELSEVNRLKLIK